jgi:acetyl-CoA synthetase
VFWCTADIGWVTGHSYVAYGPLAAGATIVMYEGAPMIPDGGRFWRICQEHGVTIFYTAPTAIRALMKLGDALPAKYDLSRLRLLGSVGEPINPEAWMWYHRVIGGGRCPIVDTWWQTETGAIMITPLPGAQASKPGSAGKPLPGIAAQVVDDDGNAVDPDTQGLLTLTRPWPGMLRTLYKDDDRFIETYFSRFGKETYLVGDAARKDSDDYFWIVGRVDDVINVSGHRLSTAEVESAIVAHPKVAEAAVVAQADEDTGQAIVAYVTLKGSHGGSVEKLEELRNHVAEKIGPIAKPANIVLTPELPKTRSGKIMRRLLRDIAEGKTLGDTTTLADPAVVARLKEEYEAEES